MTFFRTKLMTSAALGVCLLIAASTAGAAAVSAATLSGKTTTQAAAHALSKRAGIRLADVNESFKLLPNAGEGAAMDNMGYSVAVSGDTAVVGAYLNDEGVATDAGSAYVFVRGVGTTWTRQQRLIAAVPTTNDNFGFSVAISGDTLAIGAPFDDGQGAVYVYTRTSGVWSLQQRVVSTDIAAGDNFGWSVAMDANTLVVGANIDSIGSSASQLNTGSTYVFTRTSGTWSQQQRVQAADAETGDQFGASVSVSGEQLIVGAPKDNNAFGTQAGGAYIYTRTAGVWSQQTKLLPQTADASDEFGTSVSMSGTSVVVGQPFNNGVAGSNSGRASVFLQASGVWSLQANLIAADAAPDDFFGHAVAISGDLVVVGAYVDDIADVVNSGSAYVFRRNGALWTQLDKYIASDAAVNDSFGFGVALNGGTAVIGAPMDDVTGVGINSGSAYVFANGTGTTTTLNVSSNSIVFGESLTLTAQVTGGTPTGSVNFLNGSNSLGSATVDGSGQAQLVLSSPNAGNYSITANYSGDSEHLPSSSAVSAVTIARANTTMSLNSSLNSAAYGQNVTFTAALSVTAPGGGVPVGNVVFFDGGTPLATVALVAGQAQFSIDDLSVGSHNITASYAATTNHLGSTAGPLVQVINQAIVTMELVSAPNPSVDGASVLLTATLTGGIPTGNVAFQMISPNTVAIGNPTIVNGVASVSTPPLSIGSYVFQAFYTGDANHAFASDISPVHDVVPAADASITKTNGTSMVQSGQVTVYTITVTNNGPTAIIGATVVDDLNDALFDEAGSSWTCIDDGDSSCGSSGDDGDVSVLVDLPAASSVTITVNALVRATSESGVSNTATVTLPNTVADPNPGNNSATDIDRSGMFDDGFEN